MKSVIEKVKKGDIPGVQRDLNMFNIDPKLIFYDTYNQTPIFYCSLIKEEALCLKMANFFVSLGVSCPHKDTLKQTTLYYAAREGQVKLLDLLVTNGCNINEKDQYG